MREHVADVLPDDPDLLPIASSQDLGLMLHTITYDEATGAEDYAWFHARLENGRMIVPRRGASLADTISGAQ